MLLALQVVLILVVLAIAPAVGQTFQSGPIKFRLASDGGTGGNEWIVADGDITFETDKVFREFLASKQIARGARFEVYLNSPGGDFLGGVRLGETIREFGFGTRVARSVPLGITFGSYQFETDEPGSCFSACAFAFVGGVWRIAPDRSLGVHQRYSKEALAQPNAPKFNALDFSNQQMIDGLLVEYVVRMGVDARFLTRASTTAPTDMYTFTSDEMKQFGITWDDRKYSDWSFEPYREGLIAVSKTRNGENTATLFCRKETRAVRLLITSPYSSSDTNVDTLIKPAVGVSLFGAEVPTQNVSGRVDHGRFMLEIQLPSSLRSSEGNWLPDGKTPAWFVRLAQQQTNYEPTSKDWKNLSLEEQRSRRMAFGLVYKMVWVDAEL
jgi:hypothetical protein